MTIETNLNYILEYLLTDSANNTSITVDQIVRCIDLTLLSEPVAAEDLNRINHLAQHHPIAAVCVHAQQLPFIKSGNINRATVVNFPHGNAPLEVCLHEIDEAFGYGAIEIDYVFPYELYITKHNNDALNHCEAVARYCKQYELTFKIILETGAFTETCSIYQLSRELLKFDCHFLKTSTGKIPHGATLSAVLAILSAIRDSESNCGIKVSGGIKTPAQALNYAYLAEIMLGKKINPKWFRIGASSLLDELLHQ